MVREVASVVPPANPLPVIPANPGYWSANPSPIYSLATAAATPNYYGAT
jgi:hypothetical protein